MSDELIPRLSELANSQPVDARPNRRTFIARASALSLAIPGLGAAVIGCSPSDTRRQGDTATPGASKAQDGTPPRIDNSNSRLDSSAVKDAHHGTSSATAASTQDAKDTVFRRYDPTLPALSANRRVQLHWHAREAPCESAPTRSSPRGPSRATPLGRSCTAESVTRWSSRSQTTWTSRTRWTFTRRRSTPRRHSDRCRKGNPCYSPSRRSTRAPSCTTAERRPC